MSAICAYTGLGSLHSRIQTLVSIPVQVHPHIKAITCLPSDLQILTKRSMLCRPSVKQAAASCWRS